MRWGLLALGLLAACSGGRGDASREVLATVAGAPLYKDEFVHAFERYRVASAEGLPEESSTVLQRDLLLQDLLDRRLILHEAESKNVIVSIDEIETTLARMKTGWEPNGFAMQLREHDVTPAEMRREIREHLTIQRYFENHVFARIAVTEGEIEAYIQKTPDLRTVPERVTASQIVVKTREKAEQILVELKKGLAFKEAALQHSISPEGRTGGILGTFSRGAMPEAIEEVAFSASLGRPSKIVDTPYGFHILLVTARVGAQEKSNDALRTEVEAILRRRKEHAAQREVLEDLRVRTEIVVREGVLADVR